MNAVKLQYDKRHSSTSYLYSIVPGDRTESSSVSIESGLTQPTEKREEDSVIVAKINRPACSCETQFVHVAQPSCHDTDNEEIRIEVERTTASTSSPLSTISAVHATRKVGEVGLGRRESLSHHKRNLIIIPSMSVSNGLPVRLFVASLGNPPPYHMTRHSAGHILLKRLQSYLSLPPLTKSKSYGGGYVSMGSDVGQSQWTLWQSTSLMNVSGINFLKAYKTFLSDISHTDSPHGVIILHDEMETAPSTLKIKRGSTSPKGHNGIKSVQSSLQGAGLMDKLTSGPGSPRFVKVGVGIGRPASGTRDRDDVSSYVLGQLSTEEKNGIEASVAKLVGMLEDEISRIGRG